MTVFYLIRHGDNDSVGHGISGRRSGLHLNQRGQAQAEAIAARLAAHGIERVVASPMERAQETAQPLAHRLGLAIETVDAVNEVDFGDWTGVPFAQLDEDIGWRRFNRVRSLTRPPHGELMLEIQSRMVAALERMRQEQPEGRVAVVSHGDPIRVTLAYYAGIPLDLMHRLHVELASISVVELYEDEARLRSVNQTVDVS